MSATSHTLNMGAGAFEYVMRNGFSQEYGARQLLGVIRKNVEGAVSDALRANQPTRGVLVERPDGRGLCIDAVAAIELGRYA